MIWKIVKEFFAPLKAIPAYIVTGSIETWAYWKRVPLLGWVLEIIYLITLAYLFYFVIMYTGGIFERIDPPTKGSIEWWWMNLTPVSQVGAIFLWWGIYGRLAGAIMKWSGTKLKPE